MSGKFVKVKSLGCVPLEVFPPGFQIPKGDGTFIKADEVPSHMVLKLSDKSLEALVSKMKRLGIKLIDEIQVIGGRTFKVERRLDGSYTKTDVNALDRYKSEPLVGQRLTKKQRKREAKLKRINAAFDERTYRDSNLTVVRDWHQSYFGGNGTSSYVRSTPALKKDTYVGIVDKYTSFDAMIKVETEYVIESEKRASGVAVIAIHGGNTEPVTTELARCISGDTHSYYSFVSMKGVDNADLHVTSAKWEDPVSLDVVKNAVKVISLHGAGDLSETVFLGGLDKEFGHAVKKCLEARGFTVQAFNTAKFAGDSYKNIANRGATGQGLQIEISRGLRLKMFEGGLLDRTTTTKVFSDFADAILEAIDVVPNDYITLIKQVVARWTVAQGLCDHARIDLMDFIEDRAVEIGEAFENITDEEFNLIYAGLEKGDEVLINCLDEHAKVRYNLLVKQDQEAHKRLDRITARVEVLVRAQIDSKGIDSVVQIKDLVRDIVSPTTLEEILSAEPPRLLS